LNLHGSDLRKQPTSETGEVWRHGISAGQAMIMMCPRA
jgi:hypothetical protein